MSTCSLDNITTADYSSLRPEILGQLFDRILEYLQKDFEELVEKLKEQVREFGNGPTWSLDILASISIEQSGAHVYEEGITRSSLVSHPYCLPQNGHLKQDVVSLRKKLRDAVETNDDQV